MNRNYALVLLLCICSVWTIQTTTAASPENNPSLQGTVILGSRTFYRYRLCLTTEQVRQESGELEWVTVGSRGKLTPVSSDKVRSIPAPPPTEWVQPSYDDSEWARVHGKLGFMRRGTSLIYVRGKFEVKNPCDLRLTVRYQGGAAVYLNGKELTRAHLPQGKLTPDTPAEDYPEGAYIYDVTPSLNSKNQKLKGKLLVHHSWHLHHFKKDFEERVRSISAFSVPASALRKGINILAVEIHRSPGAPIMFKGRRSGPWARSGFDGIELVLTEGTGVMPNNDRPSGLQVWNQQITDRIRPTDYGDPNEELSPVKFCGPSNGVFSGRVVFGSSEAIKGVKVTCSDLTGPAAIPSSAIQIRYGTEAPGLNNYSRHTRPYETLDVSPPDEVAVPVGRRGKPQPGHGAILPVWFSIHVPKETKPGAYSGTAHISASGQKTVDVPISLEVIDWTLPDPQEFFATVGCFQSPDSLAMKYKTPMWSQQHWKLIEESLKLMGSIGVKTLYITAVRRTHMGNEHSMVVWDKNGETFKPDMGTALKYLDLAVKHMGKIPVVCLYCWELNAPNASNNPSHLTLAQRRQFERDILISVRDPKTGKLLEDTGPKWGTTECREFWKPVVASLKEGCKKHGIEKSLLLGVAGDYMPTEAALSDMKQVAGDVRWVLHSHTIKHGIGPKANYPTGYIAAAWGGHARHPDPDEGRGYGWKMPFRRVMTRSFERDPATQRILLEYLVTGRATRKRSLDFTYKPDFGLHGVGRTGADFWPVLESKRGCKTLFARYPETRWGQLNVFLWMPAIFAPGKEGPVGSVCGEMLRQNQQEIEARIFIEKAILNPETRAKIGDSLAERAQDLLDSRVRLANTKDISLINAAGTARLASELYKTTAEIAGKID